MDCHAAKSRMHEELDGPLAVGEGSELRLHLSACRSCAEAHRLLNASVDLLPSLAIREPGSDFNTKVMAGLGLCEKPAPALSWLTWAGPAFACGLAGWVAVFIGAVAFLGYDSADPGELLDLAPLLLAKTGLAISDAMAMLAQVGRGLLLALDLDRMIFPMAAATLVTTGILKTLSVQQPISRRTL